MMTRKDYIATSKILRDYYDKITVAQEEAFEEMVDRFVAFFEFDNKNFRGDLFWKSIFDEEEK